MKGEVTLTKIKLWLAKNRLSIGTVLEPVVKYLGINLDRVLSFGGHIDHVVEKARKTARAIWTLLSNIKNLKRITERYCIQQYDP